MKVRKVKIYVSTPEDSRAVQEFLFKDGCQWASGAAYVSYTDSKCLYVSPSGEVTMSVHLDDYFHSHEWEEIKFTFKDTKVATPLERAKVMVFGKTYDKVEFEAAIAKLNPI